MAKKIVKPAKKASKPAPKKAIAKPAKKGCYKKKQVNLRQKKPVAKKANC